MSNADDWRQHADANAHRLETAVDSLRRQLRTLDHRAFWAEVREVSRWSNGLKPMRPEDNQRLKSEINKLCEQAKGEEERGRKERVNISRQKRDLVERKISDAHSRARSAPSTAELKIAKQELADALQWMKKGWNHGNLMTDVVNITDGRMTPADHDACWQKHQEAQETIKWKYKEFSEAWELKQREWRTKTDAARSRTVDRIDKARSVIRRLEDQIDHCRDLQRTAKASDFESQVQGWIDEKRSKIRDIESSIDRDEEKVRDMDRRLRG